MKRTMTKAACLAALALSMTLTSNASIDKGIRVNQLPQPAQTVLTTHFPALRVAMAKMETGLLEKSYDVIFTNGDKIEFDRNGRWTDINCRHSQVPAALVPDGIIRYVADCFPGATILEIDREKKGFEVKLSNRKKILFDANLVVMNIKK